MYRRERELSSDHGGKDEETTDAASEAGSALLTRRRRQGRGCTCRFRWINNKAALMVLVWNLLVFSYQYQALDSILKLIPDYKKNLWHPWKKMSTIIALESSLPLLLYPLAGWLADSKLGRYRVMKSSIWIMWLSSIILLIDLILQYINTTNDIYSHYLSIPVVIVVYGVNAIALAGFQANIIPFGLDQMEDATADQYSSFVHWYYWTRNFSLGLVATIILHSVALTCPISPFPEHSDEIDLIVLVFEVGLLSLALIMDVCFSRVLVKEPKVQNPLQTVLKVSLFVARHKRPVGQRSAITYDRGYYSRVDLATMPYGGPFEVEDVEAVKTFWRMIVFLAIASSASIPIYTVNEEISYLVGPRVQSQNCHLNYITINALNPLVFVVALPVYELVMYPIIHKYILSMTKRVGIGFSLGLLAVVASVVLSVVIHVRHSSFTCSFYTTDHEDTVPIPDMLLSVPLLVSSFAEMLVFIPAYEFICAQSPYNMRGLLIGCFYALQGLSSGMAAVLLVVFAEGYSSHPSQNTTVGCEFWFNSSLLLFTIVALIVFFVVVRWYKNRERDYQGREFVNQRAILEAYYDVNT